MVNFFRIQFQFTDDNRDVVIEIKITLLLLLLPLPLLLLLLINMTGNAKKLSILHELGIKWQCVKESLLLRLKTVHVG